MLGVCASAQQTDNSLIVKVQISGLADGTTIAVRLGATHLNEKLIVSDRLKSGAVQLIISTNEPRLYQLYVDDTYGAVDFMANKGDEVVIQANANLQSGQGEKAYCSFSNVQIQGSEYHLQFLQKMGARFRLETWMNESVKQYDDVRAQLGKAFASKDTVQINRIKQTDSYKALTALEGSFYRKMEFTCDSSIQANKDSWWGPFLMLQMMTYFTPDQLVTYKSFSAEAQNSFYGKLVHNEISPAVEIGQKMPVFSLTSTDGTKLNGLSYLRGKKYVLIDFWASWCAPCRREIPNLKMLYERYKDKGFEIVSVSIDKSSPAWEKALREEQLPWPNFLDVDQSVSEQLKVKAIPKMFLMDANGILISDALRGEELATQLAEFFK